MKAEERFCCGACGDEFAKAEGVYVEEGPAGEFTCHACLAKAADEPRKEVACVVGHALVWLEPHLVRRMATAIGDETIKTDDYLVDYDAKETIMTVGKRRFKVVVTAL